MIFWIGAISMLSSMILCHFYFELMDKENKTWIVCLIFSLVLMLFGSFMFQADGFIKGQTAAHDGRWSVEFEDKVNED